MTETTNSLARASSAYLRSAMHQPIQWHEWGEEAFAAAQRENRPILLDIGAVWCHWCHVMDRESYESGEIAAIINREFIAVKVDRDERPDVDSRYQLAVSAISGGGGWPLTVFLTADGRPFYGGTYFPPADQFGRPSFRKILLAIADAYRERRDEVLKSADEAMNVLGGAENFTAAHGEFSPRLVGVMVQSALSLFDEKNGGFGGAPKFPHPAALDLLMDWYVRTREERVATAVTTTLTKMAQGGVYDQLAGGFHRYSVDERWTVPHFEKMSYDNSELLKNYVHGYQVFGYEFYAHVARDIMRWMDEWLSDRARGGFYASQDADISLDDDGDYFTWTRAEARAALSEQEFEAAALHYDIEETGEMHHNPAKNVLWVRALPQELASRMGIDVARVLDLLASAKTRLYAARLKRPTPFVDRTIYVNWNAMCVSAYLQAAQVLGLDDARKFALRSLDRILAEAWDEQRGMAHVIAYADQPPQQVQRPDLLGTPEPKADKRFVCGLLDDYAFTALACIDAYEVTGAISYFNFARRIADEMWRRFADRASGGFFDTEASLEEKLQLGALSARRKPFQDAPTPAGNPSAAIALLRLHAYTNAATWRDRAEQTLRLFAGAAEQFGIYAGTWGIAATWLSRPHTQIVVVGEDEKAGALLKSAIAPFAVNKSVVHLTDSEAVAQNLPPVLAETVPNLPAVKSNRSVAIVCSNFACRPPVEDPEELSGMVREAITQA
ncbi:MAG TPA: thioredoxin domain-containing protein [Candidatus Binatia bacterium]|nr:thioredoxin domain-containing protein [Candidatus Binatia bacterium]